METCGTVVIKPRSSSEESEKAMEAPRGDEAAEESAEHTVSPGKLEKGRSCGKMLLESRHMKLEEKMAEQSCVHRREW